MVARLNKGWSNQNSGPDGEAAEEAGQAVWTSPRQTSGPAGEGRGQALRLYTNRTWFK